MADDQDLSTVAVVPVPLRAAGVVGGLILGSLGALGSVPKILAGYLDHRSLLALLDGVSLSAILLLLYGLPAAIILVNAAAWRLGGCRLRRCVALTAFVSLGVAASYLLIVTAPRPHPRFDGIGGASLDFTGTRLHGLFSLAVSCVVAFGVIRTVTTSPRGGVSMTVTESVRPAGSGDGQH